MTKTMEQEARDLLDSMSCVLLRDEKTDEWSSPEDMSAGELVELANLIANGRRLRKALKEALDIADLCNGSTNGYSDDREKRLAELRKLLP